MLDRILARENFSIIERGEAEMYAQEQYNLAFEDGCYTNDEAECLTYELGIFSYEDDEELAKLEKHLENAKVDYYKKFHLPAAKTLRGIIENLLEKVLELQIRKKYLYEYTCDRVRDEAKVFYLTKGDLKQHEKVSEFSMRELSKDKIWKLMWSTCKDPQAIWGKPVCNLTENQLLLVFWSKLYDSIHESMDAPPKECIDDNYAIDGWLILQGRKREQENKKEVLKDVKGNQVFVMAKTKDEEQQIFELNDAESKRILKSEIHDMKTRGTVREQDLTHNVMEKKMKLNKIRNNGR